MQLRRILPLLVVFLIALPSFHAQTPPPTPISQEGLTSALKIGGLSTKELVQIVNQRGVAFRLTDQIAASLRAVGAAPPLIDAVRKNYRPPAVAAPAPTPAAPLPPLAKDEVITLLQVGTPPARVAQLVDQRGVSFSPTPAVTSQLQNAGADASLLAAVTRAAEKNNLPPAPEHVATAPPPPAVGSLAQVHKLFIAKMSSNLGDYLRVEIAKQLPHRFEIVMNNNEADASLVGTGQESKDVGSVLTGGYLGLHDTATGAVSIVNNQGVVLWSASAGDRTLLFGPLTRGGTPEVASRLVQALKKSLPAQ